jgi:metal-responsive CopG/Arc/MetJ family transcriptional regulator
MPTDQKQITVPIPDDWLAAITAVAAKGKRKKTDVARSALRAYLRSNGYTKLSDPPKRGVAGLAAIRANQKVKK